MLIVFFLAALASGGLTAWLLWQHGLLIALIAAAIVASAAVAVLAIVFAVARSRAPAGDAPQSRGVLDLLGPRQPR